MWCALCGAEVDKLCSLVQEGQDRLLNLTLQQLGGAFVIALDNSFDGQLKQDEEQNYLSSKLGGIGLDSIRSSVEKYDGTFNMEIQAKNFASSIVLPLPSKKNQSHPLRLTLKNKKSFQEIILKALNF